MARRRITRRVWFALWFLFGAGTAYCLYGAVHQHLRIPGRYSGHDTIYSGSAAWAIFAAALSYWLVTCTYVFVGSDDPNRGRSGTPCPGTGCFWMIFAGVSSRGTTKELVA